MNIPFWSQDPDGETRDGRVASWLSELDPGRDDPMYWMRFHRGVLADGRFELARRRRAADLTVAGVVSSWSRALVPVALAAAAAAGIMLAQPTLDMTDAPLLVEEVLTMGLDDPIPASSDWEDDDPLLLASEIY